MNCQTMVMSRACRGEKPGVEGGKHEDEVTRVEDGMMVIGRQEANDREPVLMRSLKDKWATWHGRLWTDERKLMLRAVIHAAVIRG